jgi:multicomponent Na+:H+ antiporter subunit B
VILKLHENPIVILAISVMTPIIILVALYTQAHGEHGPGGGFQAGALLASAFAGYLCANRLRLPAEIRSGESATRNEHHRDEGILQAMSRTEERRDAVDGRMRQGLCRKSAIGKFVASIERALRLIAACGVALYLGMGFFTMLLDGHFLEYARLSSSSHSGQKIGIIIVELGIGATVFAVFSLVILLFFKGDKHDR